MKWSYLIACIMCKIMPLTGNFDVLHFAFQFSPWFAINWDAHYRHIRWTGVGQTLWMFSARENELNRTLTQMFNFLYWCPKMYYLPLLVINEKSKKIIFTSYSLNGLGRLMTSLWCTLMRVLNTMMRFPLKFN